MDLPKFVDLLRTESLYLASLPNMEDEWEGAVAPIGDTTSAEALLMNTFGGTAETARNFIEVSEKHGVSSRACVFINCWHRSDVESAAMWKLYESTGRGIAVHTTVERLCDSVTDSKVTSLVEVQYVNFDDQESLDLFDLNRKYSYKRESFRHEQEVRLQHFDLMPLRAKTPAERASDPHPSERGANVDYDNVVDYGILPPGKLLTVDLARLVEGVVVAPEAPSWFIEVVRDLAGRYGHEFPVNSSAMLRRPRYGTF